MKKKLGMTIASVRRFFIDAARTFLTREAPPSYARKPAWIRNISAMETQ
ncbi:hypothetical protein LRS13_14160 [Svornostia abyssi]|uniref:Uncharacterized protein n=1 Tax=Svornostia abyssi TaxID=2898438 RepID=A0ABY5PBL3_9ACTN|nr:hypothetical protein LRS13_14160 [Parviterribacteraceae bacterium J379]